MTSRNLPIGSVACSAGCEVPENGRREAMVGHCQSQLVTNKPVELFDACGLS